MKVYEPDKYEQQAIALIRREKNAWENKSVQVSDDANFTMRNEIDESRKNYYGIFEESKDEDTNMEKMWVPATEWTVETIVKNIDLDTKDLIIKSPAAKKNDTAPLVKMITLHFLKLMNFGEFLNDFIRRLAIDGTAVAKVTYQYSPEYDRNMPKLRIVDPLNVIIDPSVYSLHEAPLIERSIMTKDQIDKKDWENKEFIKYSESSVPEAVIYERWGKIPLSLATKNSNDSDKWVEGTIIYSSKESSSQAPWINQSPSSESLNEGEGVVHKIVLNKEKYKPFEECWYKRVPNRWHGRGIPEMIKGLQTWINTVVNIRRDELFNKLAGKYKYRKGAGITRQMLESLKSGGAIPVDNMDDIQEMSEKDVMGSAYQEPREVISMMDRVTGAFEMSRGETLPPSMPATTAVLQQQGARSEFALVQENVGLFLNRLLKRHIIPMVIKSLKNDEIMRITGNRQDLVAIDEGYKNYAFNNRILNKIMAEGRIPDFEEVQMYKTTLTSDLEKMGSDRSVKILKKYFDVDYDVEVEMTSEKFDRSVMVRNLIDLLQARLPGMNANAMAGEVMEIMGLGNSKFTTGQGSEQQVGQEIQQARKEAPTQRTEFQRASIEGTLSPREGS